MTAVDTGRTELVFGPVTRTDLVRYAGASGDFTPLHHDESFCREAGLTMPFAMGMFSAGLVGTWLTDRVDPRRLRRFRVRFLDQVWPGDVLRVSGTLPADTTCGFEVEITCTRQDGTPVTQAWAAVAPED